MAQTPADTAAARDTSHLRRIEQRLRWLTVAVFLVALALLFNVAAVFGAIIEFHAGEGILIGSASVGAAVMGFVFGWLARRAT